MVEYYKNRTAFAEKFKANKGQKVISHVHQSLIAYVLDEENFNKWRNDEDFKDLMKSMSSNVSSIDEFLIMEDGLYYIIGESPSKESLIGIQSKKAYEIMDL